jgi:hypothetical protein
LELTDKGTAGEPIHLEFGIGVSVGSGFTNTFTFAVSEQPKTSVTIKFMSSVNAIGGILELVKTMLGFETIVGEIPVPDQLYRYGAAPVPITIGGIIPFIISGTPEQTAKGNRLICGGLVTIKVLVLVVVPH